MSDARNARQYIEKKESESYDERIALAKDHYTPPYMLEKIWDDKDEIREALARNPSTPARTLAMLLRTPTIDIIRSLAKNPNTDAETLEELTIACGKDFQTLYNIVLREDVSAASLEYIIDKHNDRLLIEAAKQAMARRRSEQEQQGDE